MRIEHLYISADHNFFGHHGKPAGSSPVEEVDAVECVAGRGIRGDRFFDFKEDYKGQITFFSREVYDELVERFGVTDKSPAVFRRNVVVSGVDLNDLIGETFEIQGIEFVGTQESAPCYCINLVFAVGA